jgi:hypothetical protein
MNRKDRRSGSAKVRQSKVVPLQKLQATIQQVGNAHNSLAQAFNQNTKAFMESMKYVDAMLWVLRTATNDMLNSCLATVIDGEVRQVDIPSYLRRYEEHLKVKQAPVLVNGDAHEQPVVFGGES